MAVVESASYDAYMSAVATTSSSATSPGLQVLRAAVAPFHGRLDARMGVALPGAGRCAYAQHVAAMWGWMQPIEAMVWSGGWPAEVDVPARAVKSRWLEEDLQVAREAGCLQGELQRREERPVFRSLEQRIGWAYVIESTLQSARLFERRMRPNLYPWPVRYFGGYGAEQESRWRGFIDVVSQRLATPGEIDDARRSALRAFETLEDWLRAQGAG